MKTRVIVSKKLRFIPPFCFGYDGFVLGRLVLMVEESKELLEHEMVHQNQMDRHGVIKFYFIYLKDYLKNLLKYRNHKEAYYNIPFEVEAYGDKND